MVSKLKKKIIADMRKELFPGIKNIVKRDDWIFAQDGVPSY